MAHLRILFIGFAREFLFVFHVLVFLFGFSVAPSPTVAQSASIHLTASAPWRAFADPLADATGSPLLSAVFDALTIIEMDGTLSPALADSWGNDSGTVWKFKLRSGVIFSDGTPLDATAVVDCLSMLIGPAGQVYAPYLYTGSISGVRALSENEIEITTYQKDARLDRKLANVSIFMYRPLNVSVGRNFQRVPLAQARSNPKAGRTTAHVSS